MTRLRLIPIFAPLLIAACHPHPEDRPSAMPVSPPAPTNPADGGAVASDDFNPARQYVAGLGSAFDYTAECIPAERPRIFYEGLSKRVCQLRAFPAIALLFVKTHRLNGAVEKEKAGLTKLGTLAGAAGIKVATIPFDDHTLSVPCSSDSGAHIGEACDGFLEPFFGGAQYRHWQGWGDPPDGDDNPTHTLAVAFSELFSGADVRDQSDAARARACENLESAIALLNHGMWLGDPQGFIGLEGDERGVIVYADVEDVVVASPTARPQAVAMHKRLIQRDLASIEPIRVKFCTATSKRVRRESTDH